MDLIVLSVNTRHENNILFPVSILIYSCLRKYNFPTKVLCICFLLRSQKYSLECVFFFRGAQKVVYKCDNPWSSGCGRALSLYRSPGPSVSPYIGKGVFCAFIPSNFWCGRVCARGMWNGNGNRRSLPWNQKLCWIQNVDEEKLNMIKAWSSSAIFSLGLN